MGIPKIIVKNKGKYIFVKEYPNFIMYKNIKTKALECFSKHDLGLIKEDVKPTQEGRLKGITGMKV